MRKKLRIAAILLGVVLLMVLAGLSVVYWASQQVPEFYTEVVDVDPDVQRQASEEMLQQTTALISDVKQEGRWETIFTAEQINGWLAVDLVENHPDALPDMFRDPRVAIEPDTLTVAVRFQQGRTSSVLTLPVEPYLPKPNLLALRIRKARAGLVPVPLGSLLDHVTEVAGQMGFHLRRRYEEGDPVLIVLMPSPGEEDDKLLQIDTLKLNEGEIYAAGTTSRR